MKIQCRLCRITRFAAFDSPQRTWERSHLALVSPGSRVLGCRRCMQASDPAGFFNCRLAQKMQTIPRTKAYFLLTAPPQVFKSAFESIMSRLMMSSGVAEEEAIKSCLRSFLDKSQCWCSVLMSVGALLATERGGSAQLVKWQLGKCRAEHRVRSMMPQASLDLVVFLCFFLFSCKFG